MSTWHPERSSVTAISSDIADLMWHENSDGYVTSRVAHSQRIAAQQSLPVHVEARDLAVPADVAVKEAIGRVMRQVEQQLAHQQFVADADGLQVEVLVRVSGRAWPEVPGITITRDDAISH